MAEAKKQNMGVGSVKKHMLRLAVPALVGQVVNLLYNVVDRIYIGHIPEIGGSALTGVGLFTPILMLITAFAMLSGAGGAPGAAIAMGKGDKETAGVFSVGFQISCQQAFMALGQAKVSLLLACLRKLILLIPLIFIMPLLFGEGNKVLAVFLAEPVSDITAAAVTTVTFFTFFRKLLRDKEE